MERGRPGPVAQLFPILILTGDVEGQLAVIVFEAFQFYQGNRQFKRIVTAGADLLVPFQLDRRIPGRIAASGRNDPFKRCMKISDNLAICPALPEKNSSMQSSL